MGKPNKEDLLRVMDREPWLCSCGRANRCLCKSKGIDLLTDREVLRDQVKEFEFSCRWLSLCLLQESVNLRIPPSYTLKNLVKKWASTYISNGCFIAAVIHLGIPYTSYDGSFNIHIGIKSRSPRLQADLKLLP